MTTRHQHWSPMISVSIAWDLVTIRSNVLHFIIARHAKVFITRSCILNLFKSLLILLALSLLLPKCLLFSLQALSQILFWWHVVLWWWVHVVFPCKLGDYLIPLPPYPSSQNVLHIIKDFISHTLVRYWAFRVLQDCHTSLAHSKWLHSRFLSTSPGGKTISVSAIVVPAELCVACLLRPSPTTLGEITWKVSLYSWSRVWASRQDWPITWGGRVCWGDVAWPAGWYDWITDCLWDIFWLGSCWQTRLWCYH